MSDPSSDGHLEEILAAYMEAGDAGWAPERQVLLEHYPGLRAELESFFAGQDGVASVTASLWGTPSMPPRGEAMTLTPAAGLPTAGAVLPRAFGDFEDLEEIARGGMGVVFRARQKSLGRIVALKMIVSGQFASPHDIQRFRNEAETAALMDHPNIVPIYEIGTWQPGSCDPAVPYFSMRLVEGHDLRAHLPQLSRDMRAGARVMAKVARAVHNAHQRGILHRDLKPGNILIDERGEPQVTDFGLAKRLQGPAGATQSGAIVGTPHYMAPEQAAGEALTTAADLYALGAILYELLTGRPPFPGKDLLDTLVQVRQGEPQPPRALNPQVDPDLETVCLKCLEKDPAQRYGSAQALADDLERWLRGEVILARRAGAGERLRKWARRNPSGAALLGVSAVAVLALVGTAVAMLYNSQLGKSLQKAEEARQREAQARMGETRARERAEMFQYFYHIGQAHQESRQGNVGRAETVLDGCPSQFRNWEWHYLKRVCHTELLTIRAHKDEPLGVAISPDGARIASADVQGAVKVSDARTGKVLFTLQGHRDKALSVAFSPDGNRLASASADKTVRVWSARTGESLHTLKGHTDSIHSVAFSPEGTRVASAGADRAVKLWDVTSGQEVSSLKGHKKEILGVAFTPDGKHVVSADGDETVIWDISTGKPLGSVRHPHSTSLALSADGTYVAVASDKAPVRVLQVSTGLLYYTFYPTIPTTAVPAVAFSPDRTHVASGSEDGTISIWNVTGIPISVAAPAITLRGHRGAVNGLAFSPDGAKLISSSSDGTIKVWPTTDPHQAHILKGHTNRIRALAISPDGHLLASASEDQTVRLWDLPSAREIRCLRGHQGEVCGVAFSSDGRRLASAGDDRTVRVWNAATGQALQILSNHTDRVLAVAFDRDGVRLASASADKTVRQWDLKHGQHPSTLEGHSSEVDGVAFSPTGGHIASASKDQTVKVWDAITGQTVLTMDGHRCPVHCVAFSPDGKRLASGNGIKRVPLTGKVIIWDAATGAELLTLKGHTGPVYSVAFSPDGRRLASASHDRTVKLWDMTTGDPLLTLEGHTGPVSSVAFSPDGTWLVSAGEDQTIRVWDARRLPPEIAGNPER